MRILIEGMDLVGKTTFANALTVALRLRGWETNLTKGKIESAPWHRFIEMFDANINAHSQWLNFLYILSALADRLVITEIPLSQIEITESYIDRAIAYGQAFKLGIIPKLAERNSSLFYSFDLAVLLTCKNCVRELRYAERKARTRIDLLTMDTEIHMRFQASYQHLMRRHKRVLEIDTSNQGLHECVELTVALIENVLVKHRTAQLQC